MVELIAQMPTPGPPKALPPAEVIAYVLADLAIILLAARIVGGHGSPREWRVVESAMGRKLQTLAVHDVHRRSK